MTAFIKLRDAEGGHDVALRVDAIEAIEEITPVANGPLTHVATSGHTVEVRATVDEVLQRVAQASGRVEVWGRGGR